MLVGSVLLGVAAVGATLAIAFRRVVSTNEVHIVQSAKKTTSYGKGHDGGNTYYAWPSWVPHFGTTRSILPVSVFDLTLDGYEAFDRGRLPFVVDIVAFFRVSNSTVAAERVANFAELNEQLRAIVQGAVRTILASSEIEEIMQGRSKFGAEFTKEVDEQLAHWGVSTVKNIELMDIRDSQGSKVIHNIMEKKKSYIEMESRQEVAKNRKVAEIAEVEANREVELQRQEAAQQVGLRTVQTARHVDLAKQEALQAVKESEKETKERTLAVTRVESVRAAEIKRDALVIQAHQDKETRVLAAEADLEAKKREALGIEASGAARATAEKLMQLAPVEAQIALAKEIGDNKGYQEYLVTIRRVEAEQVVGVEQAKALLNADVKIIANTGEPAKGLRSAADLFSSSGGQAVGAMLEGLAQIDLGKAIVSKVAAPTPINGAAH